MSMFRAMLGRARYLCRAIGSRLSALVHEPVYEIAGYRHRARAHYFDDTENEDEWQREVYEVARALMVRDGLRTVIDFGCGSGFKLVHILGEFDGIGVDLPPTVAAARKKYPARQWLSVDGDRVDLARADLVICADVIEHVVDPDALMRQLLRLSRKWLVLSTPDRDLVYPEPSRHRFGPPANPAHVREWNMAEFRRFAGRYLDVERHEISNTGQATQMLIGRVRE